MRVGGEMSERGGGGGHRTECEASGVREGEPGRWMGVSTPSPLGSDDPPIDPTRET